MRFFILRAHYRIPLNYSDAHLQDGRSALTRLYTALRGAPQVAEPDWNEAHALRFKAAMDDDFNTPEAVAVLFELANRVNRGETAMAGQLRALGAVLGLLERDAEVFLKASVGEADRELDAVGIEARIEARSAAKKARDSRWPMEFVPSCWRPGWCCIDCHKGIAHKLPKEYKDPDE